jgi:dihydrofolate reductase
MLFGRVTYEGFAAAWPTITDGFADRMNGIPKYVASRTLGEVEWQNSRLIEGDVVEAVSALKQEDGQNILVGGSGELADTLLRADLVDELRFLVSPVVLGSGRRFFKEGSPPKVMELVGAVPFASGVLALTYRLGACGRVTGRRVRWSHALPRCPRNARHRAGRGRDGGADLHAARDGRDAGRRARPARAVLDGSG